MGLNPINQTTPFDRLDQAQQELAGLTGMLSEYEERVAQLGALFGAPVEATLRPQLADLIEQAGVIDSVLCWAHRQRDEERADRVSDSETEYAERQALAAHARGVAEELERRSRKSGRPLDPKISQAIYQIKCRAPHKADS